ncbi:MAG TPA: isoprenylcysteine carboxylmethyltransferase family protein, partial [Phycisphaerae bacterium]|nr:isoprenylcysteine carboxylmethyltransferase family protein [Phycisphaerae bacterium]
MYTLFLFTFTYAVGFVGGFAVPRSVDAGGALSPWPVAVLVNALLLGAFALLMLAAGAVASARRKDA